MYELFPPVFHLLFKSLPTYIRRSCRIHFVPSFVDVNYKDYFANGCRVNEGYRVNSVAYVSTQFSQPCVQFHRDAGLILLE